MATEQSSEATVEKLPLEVIDRDGVKHNVVLKATIIEPGDGLSRDRAFIQKQVDQDDGSPPSKAHAAASNAEEDDLWHRLVDGRAVIIDPPYDLTFLALASDNSSELGQNVRAMVTNTVKFGWTLKESEEFFDQEERAKHEAAINKERRSLLAQLRTVHPKKSLTAIRAQAKHDKHLTGNGYIELIESPTGKLVGLEHVHGHTVRLTAIEKEPVTVEVPTVVDFKPESVKMQARFRKFVQLRQERLIFFKEAGDPRQMNKFTGEYEDKLAPELRATSLIHHRVYSPHTPYGVPEWIGALFAFFGSRKAEELNFNTLTNPIPSMFIIVENGVLTPGSIKRLKEFINQAAQSATMTRAILLEGEASEEGSPSPQQFKIRVEPLTPMQIKDELYQSFDKNNRDKIRQCFRLPPIFVGRADDYTRATADTSRDIGDEQVFAPDRDEDDDLFNRWVIVDGWKAIFHRLKSLNPNVTSDEVLVKMVAALEKSGGMTPRVANMVARDVLHRPAPLPKTIDPDSPYSLQFAQAQSGGNATQKAVEEMIEMRKRLQDELGDRFWDFAEGD